MEFKPFPKMARLSRAAILTEKLDGTNASVFITPVDAAAPEDVVGGVEGCVDCWTDGGGLFAMFAGSRTRWITPFADNFGFAAWVKANSVELRKLGVGHHFGEWWGSGIQRGYDFKNGERFFSLFNTLRWHEKGSYPMLVKEAVVDKRGVEISPEKWTTEAPACCRVVPVLYRGIFCTEAVENALETLRMCGSAAAPHFFHPEGVVVYHEAAGVGFKKTLENDESPKSLA